MPSELSWDNFVPTKRTVYELISLYEFVAVVGIALLSIVLKNRFLAFLFIMLLLKQVPEKIFKFLIFQGRDINNRPKTARDCNMINKGGDASHRSGFPSGHSTVAFFLWAFLVLEFYKQHKGTNTKVPLPPILFIVTLFALLVPMARVKIECHTTPQVLGGAVLGVLWAVLFSYALDPLLEKSISGYGSDKRAILDSIFKP
jgi:membrane-associated phospholipid phosphatase